jgi:hypothetical protein
MPSSLIFTGLVVLWLLILVPAVAQHQQEVARPSGALLAGRVLVRPRRGLAGRWTEEGVSVDDDDARTVAALPTERALVPAVRSGSTRKEVAVPRPAGTSWDDDAEPDAAEDVHADSATDDAADDSRWERPEPRYRPGRGGFDPEADARNARNRYAFRQRVVLLLLVLAVVTAVVAAVAVRQVWWAHGAVDFMLVSYLIYLRRQVRLEEAIRDRRAARMAGTRRPPAADDSDLDDWARRGREASRRPSGVDSPTDDAGSGPGSTSDSAPARRADSGADGAAELDDLDDLDEELTGWDDDGDTERVRGVGEPVGLLPARRRGADDESAEPKSALPPLQPAPPPPLPPGTSLVVVDDDEQDLHDLGATVGSGDRRAVGE